MYWAMGSAFLFSNKICVVWCMKKTIVSQILNKMTIWQGKAGSGFFEQWISCITQRVPCQMTVQAVDSLCESFLGGSSRLWYNMCENCTALILRLPSDKTGKQGCYLFSEALMVLFLLEIQALMERVGCKCVKRAGRISYAAPSVLIYCKNRENNSFL